MCKDTLASWWAETMLRERLRNWMGGVQLWGLTNPLQVKPLFAFHFPLGFDPDQQQLVPESKGQMSDVKTLAPLGDPSG